MTTPTQVRGSVVDEPTCRPGSVTPGFLASRFVPCTVADQLKPFPAFTAFSPVFSRSDRTAAELGRDSAPSPLPTVPANALLITHSVCNVGCVRNTHPTMEGGSVRMNISVPDELAEQVRTLKIPISETCQRALRHAVEIATSHDESAMEETTVDVGDPPVTVGFTGRWLVEPDSDETRTGEEGYDAGAYWGIAVTKRGRIAVYAAHCNENWPATLNDYDSLTDAERDVPADILARAAGELGEHRVIWRDI